MSYEQFFQKFMAEKVPVAQAMNIEIVEASEQGITLKAPLSANINDKGVAFGGSLFSIASLCSWAVVDSLLKRHNQEAIVFIHTSQTRFSTPVVSDFKVSCLAPTGKDLDMFLKTFNRKGKARLTLAATVYEEEALAFESVSEFVAVRK
ncbi:YiiD C-terminal domain-containing protein [Candidatus Odyssella thessalonicensis]|uniref:YiiD C-terminal domain-containing protein n=1 Tax=Candidatus Odyssella thessalonicensis TaxID=84647 RepID=UPI000225BDA0|nr:YiiD C-terminal domain-containing protein [Candidatus Odyssella thessalonicensis]